jgi:hypothetical protein
MEISRNSCPALLVTTKETPMTLRIVSDGTREGTHVTDTETGNRISPVTSIKIVADVIGGLKATITVLEPELDIKVKDYDVNP